MNVCPPEVAESVLRLYHEQYPGNIYYPGIVIGIDADHFAYITTNREAKRQEVELRRQLRRVRGILDVLCISDEFIVFEGCAGVEFPNYSGAIANRDGFVTEVIRIVSDLVDMRFMPLDNLNIENVYCLPRADGTVEPLLGNFCVGIPSFYLYRNVFAPMNRWWALAVMVLEMVLGPAWFEQNLNGEIDAERIRLRLIGIVDYLPLHWRDIVSRMLSPDFRMAEARAFLARQQEPVRLAVFESPGAAAAAQAFASPAPQARPARTPPPRPDPAARKKLQMAATPVTPNVLRDPTMDQRRGNQTPGPF